MSDSSRTGGPAGMGVAALLPFFLALGGLALFVSVVGGPRELQHFDEYLSPVGLGALCALALGVAFVKTRDRAVPAALFAVVAMLPWLLADALALRGMNEMGHSVTIFTNPFVAMDVLGVGLGEQLGESWVFTASGRLAHPQAEQWATLGAERYSTWKSAGVMTLGLLMFTLVAHALGRLERPKGHRGIAGLVVLMSLPLLGLGLDVVMLLRGVGLAADYDLESITQCKPVSPRNSCC